MTRLQLYVKGHRVADWELELPSPRNKHFKERINIRKEFIDQKILELRAAHFEVIGKYKDDFSIELLMESKMNFRDE